MSLYKCENELHSARIRLNKSAGGDPFRLQHTLTTLSGKAISIITLRCCLSFFIVLIFARRI